jgi:hypothetical protein
MCLAAPSMVPPLGRATVPPRGLAMLGSRCPTLEGSGGDTWPTTSCVPNATDKRLLMLSSQPRALPRQVHVLLRQTGIMSLQDVWIGRYGVVHAR